MKDLQIKADAGHVAWDMKRFQFLESKIDEFDSIHPSLLRQSKLNNNYGLYEVIPGIYQVRGRRPFRHHLRSRQDRLDRLRPSGFGRAGAGAPGNCFRNMWAVVCRLSAVIYSHTHGDHWGGVRGLVDEADVRSGKIVVYRACGLHAV